MGARNRGRALGTVSSGWVVGYGRALTTYAVLFTRDGPVQINNRGR